MEYFWLGLGMSILIGITLGAIVLYSKLVERLAARHPRPKSETPEDAPPSPAAPAPSIAERATAHIMSRLLGSAGPVEPASNPVAGNAREAAQPFANGRNPDNDGLTAQPLAQPAIPEDARDIMIFWANVAAVERIVTGGKVGQVEAIELIFQCKRNGRADSVYGRARAALTARSESTYRANQARLVELVAAGQEE